MHEDKITAIIELLEHVRKRPMMFMGDAQDVGRAQVFLQGVGLACHVLGYHYDVEITRQVYRERGWERLAPCPNEQMKKRGMTEEAIVLELLTLEIEMWRKLLSRSGDAIQEE